MEYINTYHAEAKGNKKKYKLSLVRILHLFLINLLYILFKGPESQIFFSFICYECRL